MHGATLLIRICARIWSGCGSSPCCHSGRIIGPLFSVTPLLDCDFASFVLEMIILIRCQSDLMTPWRVPVAQAQLSRRCRYLLLSILMYYCRRLIARLGHHVLSPGHVVVCSHDWWAVRFGQTRSSRRRGLHGGEFIICKRLKNGQCRRNPSIFSTQTFGIENISLQTPFVKNEQQSHKITMNSI